MPLHRIDHVTLNSSDLRKTCAFYGDGLGFEVAPMEGRGLKGAWLLLGGHAYVHVMARAPEQSSAIRGQVDHFAIEATDLAETRRRLQDAGLAFHENHLPDMELHQLVLQDPDGVKVELNFRGPAACGAEDAAVGRRQRRPRDAMTSALRDRT